jgi:hypothetical protein
MRHMAASTKYPNTAESDLLALVMHRVEATAPDGRRMWVEFNAPSPDEALRIARFVPLWVWQPLVNQP